MTTNPVTAVQQYIDAFKGDREGMSAAFAMPGSILDGMAPHLWPRPTASQDWYRDVLIEGEPHVASDISSRWANSCITTSQVTARTWWCPQP